MALFLVPGCYALYKYTTPEVSKAAVVPTREIIPTFPKSIAAKVERNKEIDNFEMVP